MYQELGQKIGGLVESKQQQYGDSITSMGPILEQLYPNGIKKEQYNELGLIVRMLDKIKRITLGNGEGNEDAWQDLCGYSLLGSVHCKRK